MIISHLYHQLYWKVVWESFKASICLTIDMNMSYIGKCSWVWCHIQDHMLMYKHYHNILINIFYHPCTYQWGLIIVWDIRIHSVSFSTSNNHHEIWYISLQKVQNGIDYMGYITCMCIHVCKCMNVCQLLLEYNL